RQGKGATMAKRDDPSDPEDVFWNDGEPIEPVEPAGPGLMRSGGREPWASEGEGDDPGHSWTQLLRDPVREPYGGAAGTGGAAPYGGRRFEHGRDTSAAREDGQLYGRDHRNFGHRRNPYYAGDNAIPWWEVGVP